MIRANDSVTFIMKQHINYMYKYIYIPQDIHANTFVCPLEFAFRSNYCSNGNMFRNTAEIKYIQESR